MLGAWLGRGQKDAKDYFLGGHAMPWWAVMASIVATETSALTFLSVPGDAYRTGFTFLQLAFGYLVGRIAVVGRCSCPGYFQRRDHDGLRAPRAALRRRRAAVHVAHLHGHARHGGERAPRGPRDPDRAHPRRSRCGSRS